jgi:hypothetical protein
VAYREPGTSIFSPLFFLSFMLTKLKFFFFFFFSSPLLPPIYLHQLALAIVPHPCTILPKGKDEF